VCLHSHRAIAKGQADSLQIRYITYVVLPQLLLITQACMSHIGTLCIALDCGSLRAVLVYCVTRTRDMLKYIVCVSQQ
jgi:hypothetical protein